MGKRGSKLQSTEKDPPPLCVRTLSTLGGGMGKEAQLPPKNIPSSIRLTILLFFTTDVPHVTSLLFF